MKNRALKARLLSWACALSAFSFPASAFTGKEVMEVFTLKERGMYVAGLIDMAAYNQAERGNPERATCIIHWYFSNDHGVGSLQRIEQAARNFPDEDLNRIVSALIQHACPLEDPF